MKNLKYLLPIPISIWVAANFAFWKCFRKWLRSIPPGRQTVILSNKTNFWF